MSTRLRAALAVMVACVVAVGAVFYLDHEHTYDMRTVDVSFASDQGELHGVLSLPHGEGPHGVVAFVHGDGPVNATHDDGYLPLFEAFAQVGYAAISWDKPGVGESSGRWEDQSMEQRAEEVQAALAFASARPDIDGDRTGAIGFSQAGWVLPLVAQRNADLDFVVAGSPAINWVRQGQYFTEQQLEARGADAALRRKVLQANENGRDALTGSYEGYLAWVRGLDTDVAPYFSEMSEARFGFVKRNHQVDAREALGAQSRTPTLLLFAGHDVNVDVGETKTTYERIISKDKLTVTTYPDANHSLTRHDGWMLYVTAVLAPRNIYAEGLLDDVRDFVRKHGQRL